jgi:hypothetical protein
MEYRLGRVFIRVARDHLSAEEFSKLTLLATEEAQRQKDHSEFETLL